MFFLGLASADLAPRVRSLGFRYFVACAGGLAAVCAEARPGARATALHPLERVLDAQRLVEAVAPLGAFVAATLGAEVADPHAALAALGDDLDPYRSLLARFGLAREHRISVKWDARAALRTVAERDGGPLALTRALGRDRFGKALAEAMEAERRRLADFVSALLQDAGEQALVLQARDDDELASAVIMVAPGGQPRLDAALEQIDEGLPGEPRIRCLGPLPALSFAVIELKRTDAGALARARDLLEVAPTISLDGLKSAFRLKAKAAHPDAGGDPVRFKALVEARTLLATCAGRRGADAVASIRLAGGARA